MGYQGDDQRCYKVGESLYSYINDELYHHTPSFTKRLSQKKHPHVSGEGVGAGFA